MPQRRAIATSTIIPVNSAIVLKSMPRIACSWVNTPETTMIPAPSSAMIERLMRSVMTSTYVRAKMTIATQNGSAPNSEAGALT